MLFKYFVLFLYNASLLLIDYGHWQPALMSKLAFFWQPATVRVA